MNIVFTIKNVFAFQTEYNDSKHLSVKECVERYDDWMQNGDSKYTKKNTIKIQGKIINDHSKKLCEIVDNSLPLNSHSFSLRDMNCVRIKLIKYLSITKCISFDEMTEPIIRYLHNNDIDRACWSFESKSINVQNTFSHYVNDHVTTIIFEGDQ